MNTDEITALRNEKAALIQSKQHLSSQLQAIKAQLIETLPFRTYAKLEAERLNLVAQLMLVDSWLSAIKPRIAEATFAANTKSNPAK